MAGAQQNLDNLESAGSNLLDFELIRHYVGFAFGAVRRGEVSLSHCSLQSSASRCWGFT